MVRVVEDHAAADERGAKQRRKEQDELPYSRALIRKDLQLAVEVQAEGGEAGEGDGGVAGGPGLDRILDPGAFRALADIPGIVESVVARAVTRSEGRIWLADVEEVGTKAALEEGQR